MSTQTYPLSSGSRALLLGAAGTGMRGLAYLLSKRGVGITGSDRSLVSTAGEPDLADYDWLLEEEAAEAMSNFDIVIRSDAVPADHPTVVAASKRGLPNLIYSQALGELTREYRTVAIAGTHGKTSTTALLSHILITVGLDPTVSIGARMPDWDNRNARVGTSDIFVVEADEYRNHFHHLSPHHAIITNIDYDHPDFFDSLATTEASFQKFVERIPPSGSVIVPQSTKQSHPISWPGETIAISDALPGLPLAGAHMKMNASLAIAAAKLLGIEQKEAIQALGSFTGVGRRLEPLGKLGDLEIVSDYGHHPAEIAATLSAMRELQPNKRVMAVFEAHTLERLREFGKAFADALSNADSVLVVPVFVPPGREESEYQEAISSARTLVSEIQSLGTTATYLEEYSSLKTALGGAQNSADIGLAFSAGVLDGKLREAVSLS